MTAATLSKPKKRKWRSWWLKQFHTWHWISAAVSLVGMMLFAITGLTLNHAASISASPKTVQKSGLLAPACGRCWPTRRRTMRPCRPRGGSGGARGRSEPAGRPGEWSDGEVYVAMPRPGGDAWVSIDRTSGAITSERTDRGWVSYLNDLHKGRNAGAAWFWFIDVFAVACIVFTLTGLLLLQMHARHRPSTWPLVAAGFLIPAAIAVFVLH